MTWKNDFNDVLADKRNLSRDSDNENGNPHMLSETLLFKMIGAKGKDFFNYKKKHYHV